MGWADWGKKIYGVVTNSTLDITASALGVCGSVACAAAGVGFALAQGIEKTFRASYWGSAVSAGELDITARVEDINLGVNYTLPLHVSGAKSNEQFYNLGAYIDPSTIQIVSGVLFGSGVVLRTLGSTLKKFQQYRYEVPEQTWQKQGVKTSQQEYLTVIKNSLLGSFSIGLISNSLAAYFVFYSDFLNSDLDLTYPFSGEQRANSSYSNSSYYNGPVMSVTEYIHIQFDPETIPFKIPIIGEVKVALNISVQGEVNVTAGGGVCFEKNGSTVIPLAANVALSAVAGVSAYLASNFFSRKEQRLRDERVLRNRVYLPLTEDAKEFESPINGMS